MGVEEKAWGDLNVYLGTEQQGLLCPTCSATSFVLHRLRSCYCNAAERRSKGNISWTQTLRSCWHYKSAFIACWKVLACPASTMALEMFQVFIVQEVVQSTTTELGTSRSSGPKEVTRVAFCEFSSRSTPQWTRGCQQTCCTTLTLVDQRHLRREKKERAWL